MVESLVAILITKASLSIAYGAAGLTVAIPVWAWIGVVVFLASSRLVVRKRRR